MEKKKIKCDFCMYKTASGCSTTPNSYACKNAEIELFRYISSQRQKEKLRRK